MFNPQDTLCTGSILNMAFIFFFTFNWALVPPKQFLTFMNSAVGNIDIWFPYLGGQNYSTLLGVEKMALHLGGHLFDDEYFTYAMVASIVVGTIHSTK